MSTTKNPNISSSLKPFTKKNKTKKIKYRSKNCERIGKEREKAWKELLEGPTDKEKEKLVKGKKSFSALKIKNKKNIEQLNTEIRILNEIKEKDTKDLLELQGKIVGLESEKRSVKTEKEKKILQENIDNLKKQEKQL